MWMAAYQESIGHGSNPGLVPPVLHKRPDEVLQDQPLGLVLVVVSVVDVVDADAVVDVAIDEGRAEVHVHLRK